jgi:hypothetical protein
LLISSEKNSYVNSPFSLAIFNAKEAFSIKSFISVPSLGYKEIPKFREILFRNSSKLLIPFIILLIIA